MSTRKPIPTTSDYASGNLAAAKAILERPDKYGEDSFPAKWAHRIVEQEKELKGGAE